MPIYEFECEACGELFEDLVAAGTAEQPCRACGEGVGRRRLSAVSPPARLHGGAKARDSEKRRGEREAARRDRLAETKKKRAAGESPSVSRKPVP